MELLQLQYFRTVARLEHMTKAAEELRIAQPALSMTISRLEKDLGVPLFDRRGRTIRLNQFGKAFLKKTDIALHALEEGRREVADLAGLERGSIYLVTSTLERFSEPLAAFRAIHPGINFRITQATMPEMGALLDNNEVDFCFTAMPIERPGISELLMAGEEVLLGVPPEHRFTQRKGITLQEAASEPFICYKKDNPFRKMNDHFCDIAGVSRNVVCEVDEPTAIGSLIRAGLGVAFVGQCAPESTIVKIPIEHPVCRRTFRLVWQESRYLSKAAHTFKDFLAEYFSNKKETPKPKIVS